MYQIGQTVLYGTEGVCVIREKQRMKVGHTREEYYVLQPVYRENSTIFVPVNNPALVARMRPVLSAAQIDEILHTAAQEELSWNEDAGQRKVEFARILTGGDRLEVVRLIRMLYLRRQELRSNGRHLRSGDEQVLRDAEKLLNDEFALVLQIPQREVPEYIRRSMENAG